MSPANAVVEVVPSCNVFTEPPNEIAEPSIVIDENAKSLFCIVPNVIACLARHKAWVPVTLVD